MGSSRMRGLVRAVVLAAVCCLAGAGSTSRRGLRATSTSALFACRNGPQSANDGELMDDLPCSRVFPPAVFGAGECDGRPGLMTCTCRLGQWVDCAETRSASGGGIMLPPTPAPATTAPTPAPATKAPTPAPTPAATAGGASCRYAGREYAAGSVRNSTTTTVDGTMATSCVCAASSGEWECETAPVDNTRAPSACTPGAFRQSTECSMSGCVAEACVCVTDGTWSCSPAGTPAGPTASTCPFLGGEVPIGTEIVTREEKCVCAASGRVECQEVAGVSPCDYFGFELPHGSQRSKSYTDSNGNRTEETCVCGDGNWMCQAKGSTGPRR